MLVIFYLLSGMRGKRAIRGLGWDRKMLYGGHGWNGIPAEIRLRAGRSDVMSVCDPRLGCSGATMLIR